jgi:predicted dehydrogenase
MAESTTDHAGRETPATTRRRFLQQGAAATALGAMTIPRGVHADGAGTETIKLGLIGCGGRGRDAIFNALRADPHTEVAAIGDAFRDQADRCLELLKDEPGAAGRIRVTPDRVFTGFDNYRGVIDSGIDMVVLATPPHFRPEHLEYAVAKGVHCFVEKPVAVDMQGVGRVEQACAAAKDKGLSIFSGLVWRVDHGVGETIKRVQDGAIGDVIAVQSCYNTGTLWHKGDDAAWSRMEYQIRNWLYYTWLSGDHIVEQAIHSLDKVCWLLGDASPVSAVGMGGRQQRTEKMWGNIYDHHAVTYDFPSGVKCFFTCRQQANVANFVDEIVLGSKGRAQLLARRIDGPSPWRYESDGAIPYQREHELLLDAIRKGTPINHGRYMCNSTRVAIMGRMCTYTGRKLTWQKALADDERLGPTEYAWTDVPEPRVAKPGRA